MRFKPNVSPPAQESPFKRAQANAFKYALEELHVFRVCRRADTNDDGHDLMTAVLGAFRYVDDSMDTQVFLRQVVCRLAGISAETLETAKAQIAEDVAREQKARADKRCAEFAKQFEYYHEHGQWREAELLIKRQAQRIKAESV